MTLQVISDLRKQMEEAAAVVEKVAAEMREKGRAALEPAFMQFFADNPDVQAIRWQQYTPYFNDGEECVFKVREICVQFTDDFRSKHMRHDFNARFADDERWYEGDAYYVNKASVEGQASLKRFQDFAKEIKDRDLLKAIFGDHVRIEATRSGLKVSECDHE